MLAASRETKGECEKNREQSIIDVVVVVGRKSCALVWPGALRGAERGECGDPREALGQAHSFKQATRADHLAVVVLIGVVLCCAAVWCGWLECLNFLLNATTTTVWAVSSDDFWRQIEC